MINMNTITVNSYAVSSPNVATGQPDERKLVPVVDQTDENGKLHVDSAGARIDSVDTSGDPIAALKKQIEEAQKLLAAQQAQLANAQKRQDDEQKAQQVMEIQSQIAATSSNLQVLQAALLQAMFSVDTHA
ncbi:hypothetical protein PS662_01136 [Pseudomonas fluorescens]|uniref:Uncharacterized protein n=1 Tax=Pseudomonas fluorescens TaxID=294 RepID=A0A5E6QPM2_PSEFL|nr:hypothetical protein [Pseudomonas fluorescens]VVM57603.1 hypothetical protein PS662_01136 [Pseudomonas fluorescens]